MTRVQTAAVLTSALLSSASAIGGGGPMSLDADGRIIVGYGEAFGFEGDDFSSEQREPFFDGLEFMPWSDSASGGGFLSGGGGSGFASQSSQMSAFSISGSGSTNAAADNDGSLDFASGLGSSHLEVAFSLNRPTRFALDATLNASGEGRAWARVMQASAPFDPPLYELSTELGDTGGTLEFSLPAGAYTFVLRSDVSVSFVGLAGSASGVSSFDGSLNASAGCNAADLAGPVGSLDFSDVLAFMLLFSSGDPVADLALPIGTLDFSDVFAFLSEFAAGCP